MNSEVVAFTLLPGGTLLLLAAIIGTVGLIFRQRAGVPLAAAALSALCLMPLASPWVVAAGAVSVAAMLMILRPAPTECGAICAALLPGLACGTLLMLAALHGLGTTAAATIVGVGILVIAFGVGRAPGLIVGAAMVATSLLLTFAESSRAHSPHPIPEEERSLM